MPFNGINYGFIFLRPQEENIAFIFQIIAVNLDACSTFSQEIYYFPTIVLAPVIMMKIMFTIYVLLGFISAQN